MSMIHEMTALAPRNKRTQRRGRGESSGRGKTSGRGGKGASARGGGPYWKAGHEGGQTPLFRRIPKRGFSNQNFEHRFHIVNLADLESFDAGTTVDAALLIEKGLVPDTRDPVKILGHGELTKKLTVIAGWFSKSAHEKIIKLGGTAQNLKGADFVFPKPKKKFVKHDKKKPAASAEAPAATDAAPAAAAPTEA